MLQLLWNRDVSNPCEVHDKTSYYGNIVHPGLLEAQISTQETAFSMQTS
jgi:hypothetical protein